MYEEPTSTWKCAQQRESSDKCKLKPEGDTMTRPPDECIVKVTAPNAGWRGCAASGRLRPSWGACTVAQPLGGGGDLAVSSISEHTPPFWPNHSTPWYLYKRNGSRGPQKSMYKIFIHKTPPPPRQMETARGPLNRMAKTKLTERSCSESYAAILEQPLLPAASRVHLKIHIFSN